MSTSRTPAAGDTVTYPRVSTVPFEITHIIGTDAHPDGWAYTVQGRDANGMVFSIALYQGEFGTANGWEYVR